MKRSIILAVTAAGMMLYAEPSVYGSAASYGSSKKNRQAILSLQQEVATLKREIEGLKSVVEGLNLSLNEMQQKETHSGSVAGSGEVEKLRASIENIKRNYVSRAELSKALKSGKRISSKRSAPAPKATASAKQKPAAPAKSAGKAATASKNPLETASSSALYSRGVRLVKKGKYSMAKQRFDILKKRGYKKASTHFYLGEIAYRTKRYSDAISNYKISAQANENANYMDTLLLHTGISLEKKGDKKQAKRFFQAIVDGYPDTGSAKIAKKHL